MPKIEIRAGSEINKANGAFAAANDTIYLSSDFLAKNAGNTEAVTSVLLEEIGHSIDSKINVLDAAGDEGDIFARVVQGKAISADELSGLKAEDDHATIALDGKTIQIEMDNTLGSATNLGTLNGRRDDILNSVDSSDTNDFYRFTVNQPGGLLQFAIRELTSNANVRLIRDANNNGAVDANEVLATSEGRPIEDKYAAFDNLAAGTYFVGVNQVSGNTNYRLVLNLDQAGDSSSPGTPNVFSKNTARNIGTLSSTQNFRDFIGINDPNDYYQFNLSGNSNLSLNLSSLTGNADVQLLDSNGKVIQSSTNSGNTAESINRALNAGSYFARVFPVGDATSNYNLSLSAIPQTPADADRQLGEFIGRHEYAGKVRSGDEIDRYYFTVKDRSLLQFALKNLSADASLKLIDLKDNSEKLAVKTGSGFDKLSEEVLLAGNYLMEVKKGSNSADTNYTMVLNLARTLNDSEPTSPFVRTFTGRMADISGNLSINDKAAKASTNPQDNDRYRIDINNLGTTTENNLHINLSGLNAGAGAKVVLFNDYNQPVKNLTFPTSGTLDVNNLAAGRYFIGVEQVNADTPYKLTVNLDQAGQNQNKARDLGTLKDIKDLGDYQFRDFVGKNQADGVDYYKFKVDKSRKFSFALRDLDGNANVYLEDEKGKTLASGTKLGNADELNDFDLDANKTYYMKVVSVGDDLTNYRLVLNPGDEIVSRYYPELSSLKDDDWDRETGDNIRFDGNSSNGESRAEIKQIYSDLSTAILGSQRKMNAGYLYDQSYHDQVVIKKTTGWWHSGIDFKAKAGDTVKAAVDGKIVNFFTKDSSSNGYFIEVEDKNGKQWIYGHLQSLGNWKKGDPVKVGDQIGTVGSQLGSNAHFHLAVGTKNGSVSASKNQNLVKQATMSPLEAYWLWKNS